MTLRGDRVTCDVPGCEERVNFIPDDLRSLGWTTLWVDSVGVCDICPVCRARHADDELRAKLARQETK